MNCDKCICNKVCKVRERVKELKDDLMNEQTSLPAEIKVHLVASCECDYNSVDGISKLAHLMSCSSCIKHNWCEKMVGQSEAILTLEKLIESNEDNGIVIMPVMYCKDWSARK